MPKLNATKRKKIPSNEFGLPKQRKYPMEDRRHAINAKARAKQMEERGDLSPSAVRCIDKKANRMLKNKKR